MRFAIVHTDFRIYWPARLKALTDTLAKQGILLEIIEVAGKGSRYGLADQHESLMPNWQCLFPDESMENIRPSRAKAAVLTKLDEISPDIVISGPVAFPTGAASISWAVKNLRKIIVFDDARLQDVPRSWFVNFVKYRIYCCVDAVFCPSQEWIPTFTYFGLNEDQMFYGVDVVDNKLWETNSLSKEKPPIRSKYFLTIGRQIPKKNFLFLLKSYERYRCLVKDPKHLILVGEGTEYQRLRSFTEQHQLEQMVHFYPFMKQEDLRTFFQNASWFVLPSIFGETWGLVVNEAMASGLPVMVSNQVGCGSTLVRDGLNGFTFSPYNEKELAELFLKAGSLDDIKRKEMGDLSRIIISGWGIERFCKGLLNAIEFITGIERKKPGLLSKIILKNWNGRYKPL